MNCGILFCCCWLLISFGSCVPFMKSLNKNGDQLCEISPSDKCRQKPCCGYIKNFPSSVHRVLQKITGCICEKECQRKIALCKNGICDTTKAKCVCKHCWRGPQCDKFANAHKPVPLNRKLHVSIELKQPLKKSFANITAVDKDLQLCQKNMECPCGEMVYKLEKDLGIFQINRESGELSLNQLPTLPKYDLKVIIENTGDEYTDNGNAMDVEVLVKDMHVDKSMSYATAHHRSRRAIATVHPLLIEVRPYLGSEYYFNKGDVITFKIEIKYNGTSGDPVTDINITLTSEWLVLSNPTKNGFDNAGISEQTGVFVKSILQHGTDCSGNITGTVKGTIAPLSTLALHINATATFDSNDIVIENVQSTPIVYAVFPEVNVTRSHSNSVNTYQSLGMTMSMVLPLLNYTFLVELTTNVENYVFMVIENAAIASTGSKLQYNGSASVETFSSQGNGEIDRAVIDFGYLTVPENTGPVDRSVSVTFDVKVNDHPFVANGSSHWFGVGLQAGPRALWVEQQSIEIIKVEPALELNLTSKLHSNYTRLYIGDQVTINCLILHAITSLADASDLTLTLSTEYFSLASNVGVTEHNATTYNVAITPNVSMGNQVIKNVNLTVKNNITPLLALPVTMTLNYKNAGLTQKRPVVTTLDNIVAGTPLVKYTLDGQSDVVTPGMRRTFNVKILLTKLRSPVEIELVMPKANGAPIMALLSFDLISIGSNLESFNASATPTFYSTTNDAELHDQALLNLGTGINPTTSDKDLAVNGISLKFEAIVNENSNITNSSTYWIGAGVVGKPKMVWVGQIGIKPYISANKRPDLHFTYTSNVTGDTYTFNLHINHSMSSDQVAYEVDFEYYFPPFLEFVSTTSAPHVSQAPGKTRFNFTRRLYFTDEIVHSITGKLKKDRSDKTGEFDFLVPMRLAYTNVENEKWQYWKSEKFPVKILSRTPIIPRSPQAKPKFYGRGFYVDGETGHIYVCMSQHIMAGTPACYLSLNDGEGWQALDSRIGCVLGHDSTRLLHAIARNQITQMKYNPTDKEWYPIVDKDFPAAHAFEYTNVENADNVDAEVSPPVEFTKKLGVKEWTGTGEGLFYRANNAMPWIKRANWRL